MFLMADLDVGKPCRNFAMSKSLRGFEKKIFSVDALRQADSIVLYTRMLFDSRHVSHTIHVWFISCQFSG